MKTPDKGGFYRANFDLILTAFFGENCKVKGEGKDNEKRKIWLDRRGW